MLIIKNASLSFTYPDNTISREEKYELQIGHTYDTDIDPGQYGVGVKRGGFQSGQLW